MSQNRPWAEKKSKSWLSYEFPFSLALNRVRLFWAKVTLCLIPPMLFGLIFLALAVRNPEVKLETNEYRDEPNLSVAYYEKNFSGVRVEPNKENRLDTKRYIVLSDGRLTMALTILLIGVGFSALSHFLLFALPDTQGATILIGIWLFVLYYLGLFVTGGTVSVGEELIVLGRVFKMRFC